MAGMNEDARYVQISERVDNHPRAIAGIDVQMRRKFHRHRVIAARPNR